MGIPLKYNLRNLVVRKVSTGMTVLGIALVVTVFLLVMSLAEGVRKTLSTSVSPLNVVVLRVGAQSDVQSYVSRDQYEAIRTLDGIAKGEDGQPIVSSEMVVLINIPRRDGKRTNVIVRGVEPVAIGIRDDKVKVVEGRMFRSGTSEAIVSTRLRQRFADMQIGRTIQSGSERYTVVGFFDASGSPYDSEIWADLHNVQEQAHRGTGFSSVVARATDSGARDRVVAGIKGDQRIKLEATPETEYFAKQMGTAKPIQFLAYLVAVIMAIGASFGAMNTMYAQVSARTREIATLRALGFSRTVILASFVFESMSLGLLGGVLGGAMAALIVNLFLTAPTGTNNFQTFAEIMFNFELTAPLIVAGVIFSLAMGLFGGLFPASRAARLKITNALREA
ncbi:MAG TPA: ABC transporter permease [Candidatus Polarisedimenticolia bacterium]|jgi:ABC-type lipoprotein release transport system permease subunit|nr:ABC transporter permease [Candidatus Polarisedimenticolia bacterium]